MYVYVCIESSHETTGIGNARPHDLIVVAVVEYKRLQQTGSSLCRFNDIIELLAKANFKFVCVCVLPTIPTFIIDILLLLSSPNSVHYRG